MFKCEKCNQSPSHVTAEGHVIAGRPNRIVVERKMVQHVGGGHGPRGGMGSQIVREENVCDACVAETREAPIEYAAAVPIVRKTRETVEYTE